MKKILAITILVLISSSLVFADIIQIPFDCYPKEVQKIFKKVGKKLDLNSSDRTEDSWGFIDNKGTHYDIVTYKQVSMEDLNNIQKLVMPQGR